MNTYEKLNKLAQESHNDNFQLDRLDWTTRVIVSDLCKIIDQQDEKINKLIDILINSDSGSNGHNDEHSHCVFSGVDCRFLKELLGDPHH